MSNQVSKSNFRDYLIENLPFHPTLDQQRALDTLTDFVFSFSSATSDGLDLFMLTGYAGTGKTSLIRTLVRSLPLVRLKYTLLAPTGRAAKVMTNYSGEKASTIHRKIYFSNDQDGTDSFTLGQNKHTNTIFIVDEASMIATSQGLSRDGYGRNLLEDLIEYVYSGQNCKLIFIGDEGQLPPVGMSKSPALQPDFLRTEYGLTLYQSKLEEIVRQETESGILSVAGQLRTFTESIPRLPYNTTDAKSLAGTELQEELESAISHFGRDEVMIVTRSNKRANLFNEQIRRRILWQEDDLNAGDVIMATRNNYHWLEPKSEAGFIANGELMEILKVIRREEIFGCEFADVSVRLIDFPDMKDVEIKILLNAIHTESPSVSREDMKLLFYRIAQEEYPYLRNKRERNRKVMQNPYFQAVHVKFGYAVTCHKAQGGQWSAVFVDHGYFLEEMWDEDYMRWLYTAITRASEQLFLVNFSEHFVGERETW